jgi:hypothetical protein
VPVRTLFLADTHLGFGLPARPRVERRRCGEDFFAAFELALAPALRAVRPTVTAHRRAHRTHGELGHAGLMVFVPSQRLQTCRHLAAASAAFATLPAGIW